MARSPFTRRGTAPSGATAAAREIWAASREVGTHLRQVELSILGTHGSDSIRSIEAALNELDGIEAAGVNLSTRRLTVIWRTDRDMPPVMEAVEKLGFKAHINNAAPEEQDPAFSRLIPALAVAGFAAGNIMLFSFTAWSGADEHMRQVLHWISVAIALPALAYAGSPFFASALGSLRRRRANTDVPISIGVLLAVGLSLHDIARGNEQAYFQVPVTLTFFLLVGRTLDHVMRGNARSALKSLALLAPRVARVPNDDGTYGILRTRYIMPGMSMLVDAGDRVPVDGMVVEGTSEIDNSQVSGDSMPQRVNAGSIVSAGSLNLSAPITITATASDRNSFPAEMRRLMEEAEDDRSVYRRIADRAVRLYVPLVLGAAILAFTVWMAVTGDIHRSGAVAIAVMIIACPRALRHTVPMVQAMAARRLFEHGIAIKNGFALDRLRDIDTVIFDKTGTLTEGRPRLLNGPAVTPDNMAIAASMASHSRHPLSQALAGASARRVEFDALKESAGHGLEAWRGADIYRLGGAAWALDGPPRQDTPAAKANAVLVKNGVLLEVFYFVDLLRPDIDDALDALKARGLEVHILSGDGDEPVKRLARELDVHNIAAEIRPQDKTAYLHSLAISGRKVLMVGDGLNDAPALAAAHASMAPSSSADVGRNAADYVFMQDSLAAVPFALNTAERSGRLIRQNLGAVLLYTAVALPAAALGLVPPLAAAAVMSAFSIVVMAHAFRLQSKDHRG